MPGADKSQFPKRGLTRFWFKNMNFVAEFKIPQAAENWVLLISDISKVLFNSL